MSIEITGRFSPGSRRKAAGDARPAAERDHDGILLEGGPDDGGDLVLVGGAHHDVGQPTKVAPALADQVV